MMSEDIDFEADPQEPEIVEETLPAVMGFDTQPVVAMLTAFKQEIALMVERATAIETITDEATNKLAAETALQAKELDKRLETLRKRWVGPLNEALGELNKWFKIYQEPLQNIPKLLGPKQAAYRQFLENERLRKEAEMAAENRRLQAKMEAQAKEDAEKGMPHEVVPLAAVVLPEVPHTTRTGDGTSYQRTKWVAELVDITKVDRDNLEVNWKKINALVKGGVRQLPGFIIKEVFETAYKVT